MFYYFVTEKFLNSKRMIYTTRFLQKPIVFPLFIKARRKNNTENVLRVIYVFDFELLLYRYLKHVLKEFRINYLKADAPNRRNYQTNNSVTSKTINYIRSIMVRVQNTLQICSVPFGIHANF